MTPVALVLPTQPDYGKLRPAEGPPPQRQRHDMCTPLGLLRHVAALDRSDMEPHHGWPWIRQRDPESQRKFGRHVLLRWM